MVDPVQARPWSLIGDAWRQTMQISRATGLLPRKQTNKRSSRNSNEESSITIEGHSEHHGFMLGIDGRGLQGLKDMRDYYIAQGYRVVHFKKNKKGTKMKLKLEAPDGSVITASDYI